MQSQGVSSSTLPTVPEGSERVNVSQETHGAAKDGEPKVAKKDERTPMVYQPTEEENRLGYSGVV